MLWAIWTQGSFLRMGLLDRATFWGFYPGPNVFMDLLEKIKCPLIGKNVVLNEIEIK